MRRALLSTSETPTLPDTTLTVLGCPHEADGSGYYRFYLPYQHLARSSDVRVILPEPGTKAIPSVDQITGASVDVIAGQRFCGPNGMSLWQQ
jgi:hypothetical protein